MVQNGINVEDTPKEHKLQLKDLTTDEERIITNLRKLAAEVQYGTIEVKFGIHDSQLKSGMVSVTEKRI